MRGPILDSVAEYEGRWRRTAVSPRVRRMMIVVGCLLLALLYLVKMESVLVVEHIADVPRLNLGSTKSVFFIWRRVAALCAVVLVCTYLNSPPIGSD